MDTGEVDPRTQAALDLAGTYVFGTEPGRIPAVLFAAYDASAADLDRALLGAELARCWVYSRERNRAVPFAVAAVKHAEATGDPAVLADALDAALATHWGPDELEVRVDLARKLADVAAHLGDAESRLKAHLWLLTVAAETLDVSELNRQVRALERLGEESRKALFFAATRRLMLDLMRGRADTIAPLLALARETADAAARRGHGGPRAHRVRRRTGRGGQRRTFSRRHGTARRSPSRRGSARSSPSSPGSISGSGCPTTRAGSPRRSTSESCPACRATTTTCSSCSCCSTSPWRPGSTRWSRPSRRCCSRTPVGP